MVFHELVELLPAQLLADADQLGLYAADLFALQRKQGPVGFQGRLQLPDADLLLDHGCCIQGF